MTTMTFDLIGNRSALKIRAPRKSFAARLATLQARQEHGASFLDAAGVLGRGAMASIRSPCWRGCSWRFDHTPLPSGGARHIPLALPIPRW